MKRRPLLIAVGAVAAVMLASNGLRAQIEGGGRGVAAVDSTRDFEIGGVQVDATGADADAARLAGWRMAQRKAWAQLSQRLGGATTLSDGALDAITSAIVVDNEQIGPTRYIARLGVLFDRDRTAGLLGISLFETRSPPMVVMPVVWSGGTGAVFEQRSAWQEAWARYRTSNSEIDYIRPAGTGPDALLLNVGQAQRPDRRWWRTVLDQYGGDDVLIPVVRLSRQWPGGPVIGAFEARHGPDNRLLSAFTLRVNNADGVAALLDAGVARMDTIFQDALRNGQLRPDPGLNWTPPVATPTAVPTATDLLEGDPLTPGLTTTVTVQFDTPDAAAVNSTEGAMRSVAGVSAATTSSLALGGISLMQVTFAGTADEFRAALQARGWQVLGQGLVIRVRRAPQLLPPDIGNLGG
jgi:hypothetical protein